MKPSRDQVLLPEPLATLIRQLPTRQHPGIAGRLAPGTIWLFPEQTEVAARDLEAAGRDLKRLADVLLGEAVVIEDVEEASR